MEAPLQGLHTNAQKVAAPFAHDHWCFDQVVLRESLDVRELTSSQSQFQREQASRSRAESDIDLTESSIQRKLSQL